MRRFRSRRRRLAALALLPAAVFMTTTTTLSLGASSAQSPRIDASKRNVPFGKKVTLRGSFPEAAHAAVEVSQRVDGKRRWRVVRRTHTDAEGAYAVRVKPRRNGRWRAALAEAQTRSASDGDAEATAAGASTPTRRIAVRSRTRARVSGRHLKAGREAKIRGKVKPTGAPRKVIVRVGGKKLRTKAGRNGKFKVRWRAGSTGTRKVRVKARGNKLAKGSRARAGKVTVYRPAVASWYGPGFYGNRTACGKTLTTSTLGVAHKTMPCGTKLRLRYRGRSVNVRVIDRGPYHGGREFDLTGATKRKLGFPSTGTVLSSR